MALASAGEQDDARPQVAEGPRTASLLSRGVLRGPGGCSMGPCAGDEPAPPTRLTRPDAEGQSVGLHPLTPGWGSSGTVSAGPGSLEGGGGGRRRMGAGYQSSGLGL